MKLWLYNSEESGADGWELPENFKPEISPYVRRTAIQQINQGDGGIATGDRRANSRVIRLSYNASNDDGAANLSDENYRSLLNRLVGFFRIELSPFYLVDTDNNLRTEVELSENQDQPINPGLEYIIGNNVAALEMLTGHWEDLDEQTAEYTGIIENGDTIVIDNDSFLKCYPIFRITALNNVIEFTLTNNTTGESFTFSTPSYVTGAVLVVDFSGEGLVELDGVDAMSSITEGGSITLNPGSNEIVFESALGEVSIQTTYRRRYAH